jgi:hypothetical protein
MEERATETGPASVCAAGSAERRLRNAKVVGKVFVAWMLVSTAAEVGGVAYVLVWILRNGVPSQPSSFFEKTVVQVAELLRMV